MRTVVPLFFYFRYLLALAIFCCGPQLLIASEAVGTALSNDRDILRLDVEVGPAVPAPGIRSGGTVLWTLWPSDAIGINHGTAAHKLDQSDSTLLVIANDLVWEHSIGFIEGFHALRLRGGIGVSRIHQSYHADAAHGGRDKARKLWASHVQFGMAYDFPVADLVWGRVGFWTGKSLVKDTPMTGGIYIAWVFGGQWIGIGD